MAANPKDRRIERTRQALVGAFVGLMLEGRRYDRITVGDLIARAGVGRSTFYEHYRNKEEILAETIRHPFAMLADAVKVDFDIAYLHSVLQHFRDNRIQGKAVFGGAARRAVSGVLASMIEERLRQRAKKNGLASSSALSVAAVTLANGELAAIVAWLGEGDGADVVPLANALHRIAQATAREVCGG